MPNVSVKYVYELLMTGDLHASCVSVTVGRIFCSCARAARGELTLLMSLRHPLTFVGGSTRVVDYIFELEVALRDVTRWSLVSADGDRGESDGALVVVLT